MKTTVKNLTKAVAVIAAMVIMPAFGADRTVNFEDGINAARVIKEINSARTETTKTNGKELDKNTAPVPKNEQLDALISNITVKISGAKN